MLVKEHIALISVVLGIDVVVVIDVVVDVIVVVVIFKGGMLLHLQ